MTQVREVLRRKNPVLITVEPFTEVRTAVRLLLQHNIGGLPVVAQDGQLVGFLGERDLVTAMDRHQAAVRDLHVSEVMRPPPTCATDDPLREVMARMTRERLRHLVVVDGDRLAGILSIGDLVKHRLDELETETGVLRDYLTAHRAAV